MCFVFFLWLTGTYRQPDLPADLPHTVDTIESVWREESTHQHHDAAAHTPLLRVVNEICGSLFIAARYGRETGGNTHRIKKEFEVEN